MLGGLEIRKLVYERKVFIEPFNDSQLNPNSYNCKLSPNLKIYKLDDLEYIDPFTGQSSIVKGLDLKQKPRTKSLVIPASGMTLIPGILYLGCTQERFNTGGYHADIIWMPQYAPHMETRSGIARAGISSHLSAGWGDVGFSGCFTLEITVVHPVRIYPGIEICQVAFVEPQGHYLPYKGKYRDSCEPTETMVWKEFQK